MNKLLAGMLACGLLAGCGAHAAEDTAARSTVPASRYVVCQSLVGVCEGTTPKHEPSEVYLSADGSGFAKDLAWTGWGTAAAIGHGIEEIDNCRPNCAQGTYTGYPVRITLTLPRPWHRDLAYTRAVVSIPSLHRQETYDTGLLPRPLPSFTPAAPTTPPAGP